MNFIEVIPIHCEAIKINQSCNREFIAISLMINKTMLVF